MKLPSSLLALVLLGSVLSDANAADLIIVYTSHLDTRSGTPVRTPHWTDPATSGAQLISRSQWWTGATFGAVPVTGSVYPGWIDSSQTMANTCATGTLSQDVLKVVGVPKNSPFGGTIYVPPPGKTVVIVQPNGTPCYDTGGAGGMIYTTNGAYIEHELGHVLGLGHSYEQHCQSGSCGSYEYGHYSVMGTFTGISPSERERLGGFGTPTYTMPTITASQTVVLQLSDTSTPGVKSAKINAPGLGSSYVEYRNGDYVSKGVILWTGDTLLDMDRTSPALQWILLLGQTYCVAANAWCVTVTAQDALTSTVAVTIGGLPPVQPPPPPPPAPNANLQWRDLGPSDGLSIPNAAAKSTGVTVQITTTDDSGIASVVLSWAYPPTASPTTFIAAKAGDTYSVIAKPQSGPGTRGWWFTITANDGEVITTPKRTVTVIP